MSDSSSDPESPPSSSEEEEEEQENLEELGQKVANYLIDAHSMKITVKKSEIIKNCLDKDRKLYTAVLDKAKGLIKNTFGFDVKEGQHSQETLLFLIDPAGLDATLIDDLQFKRRHTLLFLILGYITMKTPPVPETSIINFLEKLGIQTIDDPVFGNVQDQLSKAYLSNYYLKQSKNVDQASGEQTILYDWGARSFAEVNRDQLLNSFSEIIGKPVQSFVQPAVVVNPNSSQRGPAARGSN